VIPLTLAEVARATDGRVVGDPGAVVVAVVTDSRRAGPGDLFVALRGDHADGGDKGAAGVLVEGAAAVPAGTAGVVVDDTWQAVGRLGAHVRSVVDPTVVAITGSVGKTTTKDLVAAAVGVDRRTVAAEGSYNNELGVPLTLLATEADTEVLVVEVGARGIGHIASLVPWVRPDVSVVTAVAGAHLEMFGDLEGVASAKGELVEVLPPDALAVLNAADQRVWAMRARTEARVVGYGDGGEVHAEDVTLDERALASAVVVTPWGRTRLRVPLPGRHNLDNALAALAVAGALGVPVEDAAAGIAAGRVSRWRGELEERADGLLVLNDSYNANPTAVRAALDVLADLARPGGRTVAVLGHMAELGHGAAEGHADVGAVAGGTADLVVAVGSTYGLATAAAAAGARVVAVEDPAAAVEELRGRVGRDDVVLVKASRSAGLERVAAGLLDDTTPRDEQRRPSRSEPTPGSSSSLGRPGLGRTEEQQQ
jgi:UDP-N-acetylmuramoyl-tripeptide--D-alanyl-D-alanine ligase